MGEADSPKSGGKTIKLDDAHMKVINKGCCSMSRMASVYAGSDEFFDDCCCSNSTYGD